MQGRLPELVPAVLALVIPNTVRNLLYSCHSERSEESAFHGYIFNKIEQDGLRRHSISIFDVEKFTNTKVTPRPSHKAIN